MEKYTVVSYNFMYGLLLDIIMVGIAKRLVRRERPENGKLSIDLYFDKYSFPSDRVKTSSFFIRTPPTFFAFLPFFLHFCLFCMNFEAEYA